MFQGLFQLCFKSCFKAFFSTVSRHVSSLFHGFSSITVFHRLFQHCFKPCFSGSKACFIPCIKALLATGLDQSVLSLVSLLLPSEIQFSFKTCFSTFQMGFKICFKASINLVSRLELALVKGAFTFNLTLILAQFKDDLSPVLALLKKGVIALF